MDLILVKIAKEYIDGKKRGVTGYRYVYEEMVYAVRQLDNGMTEYEVYDTWGKRSRLLPYMKLSAMITQNLRKGNRDMLERFQIMSIDAMEERKAALKKMGEKASSKMLLPLMIQFSIILVIIMYPAIVNM